MLRRLAYLREKLDTSIWLIPMLICLVGAMLAFSMLWLDRQVYALELGPQMFAMPVDSARQVLSVIAASVISVGGVSFSVTMVALTLTSGQYGPKVLRHFLEDNDSKISLGLFFGTYVYSLIVLTGYLETDQPHLTVLGALLLAFVALLGFIRFIHLTATDLQADKIIQRIGRQLLSAFNNLVNTEQSSARSIDTLPWRRAARSYRPHLIASSQQGYLQTIDYPGLVNWCVEHDCTLQVRRRAGDFIVEGICLFKVFGCPAEQLSDAVNELNGYIICGPIRTPTQDPEYPITQLNQLAARALSPGINDPETAITCIDWFSLSLVQVVDHDLPGSVFLDQDGTPRLLAKFTHFPGIMKAIYAQLRQFAKSEVSVTVSLFESLCRLAELTTRTDRLAILALHGQLIWNEITDKELTSYDVADLKQRYKKLLVLTSRFSP